MSEHARRQRNVVTYMFPVRIGSRGVTHSLPSLLLSNLECCQVHALSCAVCRYVLLSRIKLSSMQEMEGDPSGHKSKRPEKSRKAGGSLRSETSGWYVVEGL